MATKKPKPKKKKTVAKKAAAKKKKPAAKKKKNTAAKKKTALKKKTKKGTQRRRNSFAYGVRTMGPMRLATVVATDPGAAWNAMMPLMKERALTGQALAAFFMSEEKTIKSYAASVEIAEGDAVEAPLVEQRIDASSYACTSFAGSFDKLGETWSWFVGHVTNIGHTIDISRPFLEIYISDGKSAADGLPRTELCIPV